MKQRVIDPAQSVEVANINGKIEVRYEQDAIKPYVLDILTLGLCRFFFSGSFVCDSGRILASYQTEGFRRLTSLKHIGTEDIFTIVISVLQGASAGERHYIFSEEYDIDAESVFVDKSISAVKLIFTPSVYKNTLSEKMIHLLHFFREVGADEGIPYIDNAAAFIEENGENDHAVIHHLENLRREIYLCSVE